ncbi:MULTISPECIES: hypothetical protein [unclassified Nocardioides]|uniref:hypothetical protein n=1 Tax=unclassified Nocardioides TaxID=2615069 RepID=UPI003014C5BD
MSTAPPRGRAALVLALAALLVLVAGPARAHPFGPPQQVTVDADGDPGTVRVHWQVGGTDDLTLLAVSLGVLPEDRVLLDGAVAYEDDDAAALAAAPAFRDYLLDHVVVEGNGAACAGEVTADDDLATAGVRLDFTCADDVTTAAVEVTMLTDLHPAYRTLATGPAGQRAVYDGEQTRHDWTLGEHAGNGGTGTSALLQVGAVLGVLLLGVVAGLGWLRRRGGRYPS